MPEKFYEDPNGIRDVLDAHDDDAERAMEARDAEEIEKILDVAVGADRDRVGRQVRLAATGSVC